MMQRILSTTSKKAFATATNVRCLSFSNLPLTNFRVRQGGIRGRNTRLHQPSVRFLSSATPPTEPNQKEESKSDASSTVKKEPSNDQSKQFHDEKKDASSEPESSGVVGKAIRFFIAFAVLGYFIDIESFINPKPQKKEDEVVDELADLQAKVTHRVFLDVKLPNQEEPERIVIGLYGDVCPKTVLNFKTLCEGFVASDGASLSYKGSPVHRVIPAFMMQSGDFTNGDGTGGRSIFTTNVFPDESFQLKHRGLGVLSMANSGKNTNRSQFFICFKSTPWLDGRHVVFGQVLHGVTTLRKVESLGSRSGKVEGDIRIVDCGVLPDLQDTLVMNNDKEEIDETGHNVKRIMK